jgi:hypothetical protein
MMQVGTIHVVLTMNFDRLFEQALREIGIEPPSLPQRQTLKGCLRCTRCSTA